MQPSVGLLTDATITLTGEESDHVRRSCAETVSEIDGSPLDSRHVMVETEIAGCTLPPRLLRELAVFRQNGNSYGALLIRNVPIDPVIGATPPRGETIDWHQVPIASVVQLAMTARLGDVIAFADEKNGRLLQDVVPVPGAEGRQENSGTTFMELHTENGFHPYKPDFVTLLCLRPDHERLACTLTASVHRLLPRLSPQCLRTLREPVFRIRFASSFAVGGHSEPLAALPGPAHHPDLIADFHAMDPLTEAARRALEEVKAAIPHVLFGAVLDAGDLLVVDNRVALHGRRGFDARHDGRDRWLRRCFAAVDLHRSRGFRPPDSRVCAPLSMIRGEGRDLDRAEIVVGA